MPTIEIKLTVPEGTTVVIEGVEASGLGSALSQAEAIERYWRDYLSDNARRLFRAAAGIEQGRDDGYTLEDIAAVMSITYESVRSYLQTSGRCARRWRQETGTEEPIRLEWKRYEELPGHGGMRTSYRMPAGVADLVRELATGG